MQSDFEKFRKEYPVFSYDGFSTVCSDGTVRVRFDFSVPGLCEFHPETTIHTDNLTLLNGYDSGEARKIIFALGLVEAVSYWKCVCSPKFVIRCGLLNEPDKLWWKKLWYNGLGEFFYKNRIETNFESFVEIENVFEPGTGETAISEPAFQSSGLNIIPVGGGKDSCVTLELLKELKAKNLCFTVNDQPARTQTAAAAGYAQSEIIRTTRQIDSELLKRNAEGFLNGHTPFSSVVAFLSMYCAFITGAENIILSNESSANEASVCGTDINHQYSKSFEFETDFALYAKSHFSGNINYFSLLRPFNELQIAKKFAALKKYHPVFRSCNAGSKKNIWCGNCAKCLFVYIILSPFLECAELNDIFGINLLGREELLKDFEGLAGLTAEKPFECIGTVDEVRCALEMTAEKYTGAFFELPFLLKYYKDKTSGLRTKSPAEMLGALNEETGVPQAFYKYVKEMYDDVSKAD
jgi:UDP-N-acetyl-alpha-D-muramoyl-L-alanyl-L-glutamate epimerase